MKYQRLKKMDMYKVVDTLKKIYKMNLDDVTNLGEEIRIFLEKQIKESNYKDALNEIELHFLEVYKNRDLSTLFKNIEECLNNPLNYLPDLNCTVYMAYLYNDYRSDIIDGLLNEIDINTENMDEADEKFIEELEKKAEDIAEFWSYKNNRFDKNCIRKNYPVPVNEYEDECEIAEADKTAKVDETVEADKTARAAETAEADKTAETDEKAKADEIAEADKENNSVHTLSSLPGGCIDFHHIMLSNENIGVFDLKGKNNIDYTRYAFGKANKIYEDLKQCGIENLLLMEYSLGIGVSNQIFNYVKELTRFRELKSLELLIQASADSPFFFIRKKILQEIWHYVMSSDWMMDIVEKKEDNAIEEEPVIVAYVCDILYCVNDLLDAIFEKCINLYWNICCYLLNTEERESVLYYLRSSLRAEWDDYYDDAVAYSEWVRSTQTHNWKNVECVEDCFSQYWHSKEDKLRYTGTIDTIVGADAVIPYIFKFRYGETQQLNIERPMNEIGYYILDEIEKRWMKKESPENRNTLYEIYYKERTDIFNELKKQEMGIWRKKNIKIDEEKVKTVKSEHIYAWVHREIMEVLLRNRT
ncbi:hypothetical protein [Eubacterium ramulus]